VIEANAVPFTNKTRLVTIPSVFVTVATTGMLPEAGYVEPDTGAIVTVGEGGMVKVTGSEVLSTPLESWATTYAVCGPDASGASAPTEGIGRVGIPHVEPSQKNPPSLRPLSHLLPSCKIDESTVGHRLACLGLVSTTVAPGSGVTVTYVGPDQVVLPSGSVAAAMNT